MNIITGLAGGSQQVGLPPQVTMIQFKAHQMQADITHLDLQIFREKHKVWYDQSVQDKEITSSITI
jgi:hypothetical protein